MTMTRKRNDVRRSGTGSGSYFRDRDRCSRGHVYTPENTWIRTGPSGGRRCRTCDDERMFKHQAKLKQEVINAYGGKCNWSGCEVIDPDMLTLDHVNNDGGQDRAENGILSGTATYRKVKREGFPARYQILCMNHQFKKEVVRRRQSHIRGTN